TADQAPLHARATAHHAGGGVAGKTGHTGSPGSAGTTRAGHTANGVEPGCTGGLETAGPTRRRNTVTLPDINPKRNNVLQTWSKSFAERTLWEKAADGDWWVPKSRRGRRFRQQVRPLPLEK